MLWLFLLFILSGCREMGNHQPIMPRFDKETAKDLAKPAENITVPEGNTRVAPKKVPQLIPKAMYTNISVSVSEGIPLKTIFIELARQANVDLQLDPGIDAKIIFTANDRPFIEVVESMCEMANLRFDIIGNALRIERDTLYPKNYNVQFLNLSRSSDNQLAVATDVFSSVGPVKGNIGDNVSKSALKATTKNDFWDELEQNLKTIIETSAEKGAYSIHRQAGLISLKANRRQHLQVEKYLEQLRRVACCQVLIEAKIIEVTLKDEYRSGIDWHTVGSNGDLKITANFGDLAKKSIFLDPTTAQTDMISFGASGKRFSGIANMLQEFGFVRTLSSPRLTVMNNQAAILKVAQNKVYFRLNYDKIYNSQTTRESTTVSSDIQTVPIGLIMMVQPSIDPQTGEIILFLRPSISRLTQTVADPAVDIAYNASVTSNADKQSSPTQSLIPVVEVREIDSVLRLNDKEMAILGGLMEVRSSEHKQGIPGLGEVPIIRDLTGNISEGDTIVELVIVLKATIVDNGAMPPDGADHRLMEKYTTDPRPIS